jgi:hypothetical protein
LETGLFAEKEGFEPPDLLQSAVFKTAAIDHSATSLKVKWQNGELAKRGSYFTKSLPYHFVERGGFEPPIPLQV